MGNQSVLSVSQILKNDSAQKQKIDQS